MRLIFGPRNVRREYCYLIINMTDGTGDRLCADPAVFFPYYRRGALRFHWQRLCESDFYSAPVFLIVFTRSQIRIEAVKLISSNRSSGDVIAFGAITMHNSFFDLFQTDEPIDVVFKSRVSHLSRL